jgi:hypothetical protein
MRAWLRRSEQEIRLAFAQCVPELKRAANFALELQSLGPVERFGRAVDRGFLAFVLLLAFDFFAFAFGIITSDLPIH